MNPARSDLIEELNAVLASMAHDSARHQAQFVGQVEKLSGVALSHVFYPFLEWLRVRSMRVKELVPLVGTTAATVTRHVQYLENIGLVERWPDEEDRRSSILGLTPKGLEVWDYVQRVRTSFLEQCLREWPTEDIQQLLPLFSNLTRSLSEGRELTEVDVDGVPRPGLT